MNDLDRLFQHLVYVLTTKDSSRLLAPFQVSELYQSILPYRTHKKQLGFDTNQDYEMAVLRLLAGENNYATVEPTEVQEQLRLEAEAIDPNPGAFRKFAAARVTLNQDSVSSAGNATYDYAPPHADEPVDPTPEAEGWEEFAPPNDDTEQSADPQPEPEPPVFEAVETPPAEPEPVPLKLYQASPRTNSRTNEEPHCRHCAETLPMGRKVRYCPFCGEPVGPAVCSECGNEVEKEWRFCAVCGATATSV